MLESNHDSRPRFDAKQYMCCHIIADPLAIEVCFNKEFGSVQKQKVHQFADRWLIDT